VPAAESLPFVAAKRLQETVAEVGAAPTARIAALVKNAATATSVRVTNWASVTRRPAAPSNEGNRLGERR
jgi:hypothetical protein